MPLSYLAAELRKADPDLYLLSLFAPADRREALWALFLFNHEISKTRSVVSDTTLGLIRLQWWRDEIAKLYTGGPCGQNPVLSTLEDAIKKYDLPQSDFETLIYAHEFDLEDVAPANMDGLYHYADFTTTPLLSMALKIAGEEVAVEDIRVIAIDFSLLRLIRATPFMLAHRQCLLPEDLLSEKGMNAQKICDSNSKDIVVQLLKVIKPVSKTNKRIKSSFLRKFLNYNRIYLKYLDQMGFDVFSARGQSVPPFLALRLAVSK